MSRGVFANAKVDTAPADPFKRELTNGEVEVADHFVPFTQAGRLWVRLESSPIRNYGKEGFKRAPQPLRRGVTTALRRL
jgi:hypothetical protein